MSNIESAIADDVKLYHRHNADRIKALLAAGDKLLIARPTPSTANGCIY